MTDHNPTPEDWQVVMERSVTVRDLMLEAAEAAVKAEAAGNDADIVLVALNLVKGIQAAQRGEL